MPFPLVSHQGLAAPVLVADRKRRLDGVAFLAGTLAPDLPYAVDRTRFDFDVLGHSSPGLVLWCVPLAVLGAMLFRRVVARPLAVHLPDLGTFRLKDVGFAAGDRPGLAVTALSGLLGALTHLWFDSFTHPEPWAVERFPVLMDEAPITLPDPGPTHWYDILHVIADYGGVALAVTLLWWAGWSRARAGRARPELPPPTADSAMAFWGPIAAGAFVGLALAARVWGPETMAQGTMLLTWSVAAGTVVGSALSAKVEPTEGPGRTDGWS